MPTPEQLQRFIAERLGWTKVKISCVGKYNGKPKYCLMGFPPGHQRRGGYVPVPGWPTDRKARETTEYLRAGLCEVLASL